MHPHKRRKVRALAIVAVGLLLWSARSAEAQEEYEGPLSGGGPPGHSKRRTLGTAPETNRKPGRVTPPARLAPTPSVKGPPVEADPSGAPIVDVWGPKHRPATPAEVAQEQARKAREKPPGTAPASPELEPRHGRTPAGYDPAQARARARGVAAHLAKRGPKAYDVALLREWQTLAGIHADGAYGGSSRGALVHYGVTNPPRPFSAPFATLPYVPPEEP